MSSTASHATVTMRLNKGLCASYSQPMHLVQSVYVPTGLSEYHQLLAVHSPHCADQNAVVIPCLELDSGMPNPTAQ